jgi:FkbM family methyltransferase
MINTLRFKVKKNFFLNNLIIYIKFLFNLGLEKEAKYIKKNYQFNISVDIGSNTGHFTNMLSKISNKVYSFEPINYLFKSQKYLFDKKNIKNYNCALGSKKQRRKFYIPINNDPEASLSVKENSNIISVNVNKGDEVLKGKKINFIKIDVEGHELDVLIGLKNIIKKNNPLLLVEIEKRHNKNYIKVFNFLKSSGYKTYYLNKDKFKIKYLPYKNINSFLKRNQNTDKINSKEYVNNFFFKKY